MSVANMEEIYPLVIHSFILTEVNLFLKTLNHTIIIGTPCIYYFAQPLFANNTALGLIL